MKTCACGAQYDADGWRKLPLVGTMGDDEETLELRNCPYPCLSTLAVTIPRKQAETA